MKEEEMTQLRLETAKQTKLAEVTQKKLRHIKDQKADVEEQRETLMAQIAALEKGMFGFFFNTSKTHNFSLQFFLLYILNIAW